MEKWRVTDCNARGHYERVDYTAKDLNNETVFKYANVYLPYGYSEKEQYNILYLMHGGGGNPDSWFDQSPLKNILDNLIANGTIQPMIVVTPTFYVDRNGSGLDFMSPQTRNFAKEFCEYLIPAVEGKYSTYAASVKDEDIRASRMHRAFGGFSMGCTTCWFVFRENLSRVGWFLPLSGEDWDLQIFGGGQQPEATAASLREAVLASGVGDQYFIYNFTGSKDMVHDGFLKQAQAMSALTDVFSEKNYRYHIEPDFVHAYGDVVNYLILGLPEIFR